MPEHMDSNLPDVVLNDVDRYIDNLDGLEVVMLIYREQSSTWTPDQVMAKLKISLRVARRELDKMKSNGIAKTDGGYQFDDSDPEKSASIARISAIYGTRRVELINYVATQTLKRIQSIADAFKIKKEDR